MPNRRAAHKQSVTISIPKALVYKIDLIAELTNRSRTYIIEHLIRSQIDLEEDKIKTDKQVLYTAQKLKEEKKR
jgi:predicted transcriptional regulator